MLDIACQLGTLSNKYRQLQRIENNIYLPARPVKNIQHAFLPVEHCMDTQKKERHLFIWARTHMHFPI